MPSLPTYRDQRGQDVGAGRTKGVGVVGLTRAALNVSSRRFAAASMDPEAQRLVINSWWSLAWWWACFGGLGCIVGLLAIFCIAINPSAMIVSIDRAQDSASGAAWQSFSNFPLGIDHVVIRVRDLEPMLAFTPMFRLRSCCQRAIGSCTGGGSALIDLVPVNGVSSRSGGASGDKEPGGFRSPRAIKVYIQGSAA